MTLKEKRRQQERISLWVVRGIAVRFNDFSREEKKQVSENSSYSLDCYYRFNDSPREEKTARCLLVDLPAENPVRFNDS